MLDMFFLPLYPWDNLYCLSCQDYCPSKDKLTDRPVSLQLAKGAALSYHHHPWGFRCKIPIAGLVNTFQKQLHIQPFICQMPHYRAYIFFMIEGTLYLFAIINPVNEWRERPRKGSGTSEQRWSTHCHSSINPLFSLSLCAPHPPCLPALKAAAVFVWSAKTPLPLLAFIEPCMEGGEGGEEGPWWVFEWVGRWVGVFWGQ